MAVCAKCGEENPDKAKFCLECGAPLRTEEETRREVRKTVTVLFSDVTGSTSLGERTDPESLRRVMSRYFEEMKRVLEHHGATVEKFIGDAVMAVFGIPRLHEDDALRAVRAAAEMRDALQVLNKELERDHGIVIAVRTGLNTGEVVSGDSTADQALVTGHAVNIAARLEQTAGAGEILIGADTHRLVRDAVEAEEIGPVALKGKGEPVQAYRLLTVASGVAGVARKLDSPLVGRTNELLLLRQAFERCVRENACHLFTILGIAGVGKSRLVADFVAGLDSAIVLSGRCLPYGDGITFWPVMEIVSEAAGIDDADPADVARAKIRALLTTDPDVELLETRVAEMVGLREASAPSEEIFWAARRLLETLARHKPLIIVFDDIHWAEPTLLDFVEHLSEWTRDAPLLVVALARPELLDERQAWAGGKLNATTILLEALSDEESRELIQNLLGKADLEPEAEKRITQAAEGTPLFMEEMLAMLIDDGLLEPTNGRWAPTRDLSQIAVPPTIQALLSARLDRLEHEERSVLETASVVGKVFWQEAVADLFPEPRRSRVGVHLKSLVRRELIRPDTPSSAGQTQFRFRHILIRDASYDSMSKETRAELHERYARWLERTAGDRLLENEEVIGYHLEQACYYRQELGRRAPHLIELERDAARRLAAAGQRALGRGDMPAAVNLLSRVTDLLPAGDPERAWLLLDLADAQIESGDFEAATASLDEVGELRPSGDWDTLPAHVSVVRLKLDYMTMTTNYSRPGRRELDRLLPIFEKANDVRGLAKAWTLKALLGILLCRAEDAQAAALKAVEYARRAGDAREEAENVWWLLASASLGPTPPAEILKRCDEIEAQGHAGSRAMMASLLLNRGNAEAMLGNFDAARMLHEGGRAILLDLGLKIMYAATAMGTGWIETAAGDHEAAERGLREGYEILEETGEKGYLSTVAAELADALYNQGRLDEAERYVQAARDASAPDDVASQSLWRSVQAKIHARRGEVDDARRLGYAALFFYERADFVHLHGDTLMDLSEVLELSGDLEGALIAAREALEKFEQKGHVPATERARRRIAELER